MLTGYDLPYHAIHDYALPDYVLSDCGTILHVTMVHGTAIKPLQRANHFQRRLFYRRTNSDRIRWTFFQMTGALKGDSGLFLP